MGKAEAMPTSDCRHVVNVLLRNMKCDELCSRKGWFQKGLHGETSVAHQLEIFQGSHIYPPGHLGVTHMVSFVNSPGKCQTKLENRNIQCCHTQNLKLNNINDFRFEISNQNIQRFIDIKKRIQNRLVNQNFLFVKNKNKLTENNSRFRIFF